MTPTRYAHILLAIASALVFTTIAVLWLQGQGVI